MPFILCATICCCLPCIISILGTREDLSQTRGATTESINALPTYKFKSKKTANDDDQEDSAGEGGILAAGTEKERLISGEDAVSSNAKNLLIVYCSLHVNRSHINLHS